MKKKRLTRQLSKKQIGLQLDTSGEKPVLIKFVIKEMQCSTKRIVEPAGVKKLSPAAYRCIKSLIPHKPLYARLVLTIQKDAAGGHIPELEA